MRLLKIKLFTFLTLILCMGVFCFPVFASDGSGEETLTVGAVWVDGELLRINVTDAEGTNSALALRLSDYVKDAENKEYISIQAVDLNGNKSGIIEIKNPYYVPPTESKNESENITVIPQPNVPPQSSTSSVLDENKSFTPNGTGTVMDNATDGDGKEFFTIDTEDGSVFYLIVDRQRNSDNVYLLNAVTEEDLMALAKKNGKTISSSSTSAIQTPGQTESTEEQTKQPPNGTSEPETIPPTKTPASGNNSMYIFMGIAVVVVGGVGYYFKIVRGKKNNLNMDDGEGEDEDEDEYGYSDKTEESDLDDGSDDE